MSLDYLSYYDEKYLFEDVARRFHQSKQLDAFDLFSIVIWKANRAKTRIADLMRRKAPGDLDAVSRLFTSELYNARDGQSRLELAINSWGFSLPMASAILTVLWPEEFTVYDYRVCELLESLHAKAPFLRLENRSRVDSAYWQAYCEFRDAVISATPEGLSLRNKDRYLSGQSAARELISDVKNNFERLRHPVSDLEQPTEN